MQNEIQEKEETINNEKERYDVLKHKIYTLLRRKYNMFMKRIYFNEIVYYFQL